MRSDEALHEVTRESMYALDLLKALEQRNEVVSYSEKRDHVSGTTSDAADPPNAAPLAMKFKEGISASSRGPLKDGGRRKQATDLNCVLRSGDV